MRLDSLKNLFPGQGAVIGSGNLFQAWRDGLLDCLPINLRRRLQRRGSRLILELVGGGMRSRLELAGGKDEDQELDPADDGVLGRTLQRARQANAELTLSADPRDVLVRRINLPLQAKNNLAKVLGYEMDRITPFKPAAVYFDYHIVSAVGTDQLVVELALLRRDRVDVRLTALDRACAPVASQGWPDAWPGANLLPPERRPRAGRTDRIVSTLLWLFVSGLALAVVMTPLLQKQRLAEEIAAETAAARAQAREAVDLRESLEQARESAGFILEKKRNSIYASEVLRRLTELMPDHTWVNQMTFNHHSVDFRGESKQASGLIEILSGDPDFHSISFKSPVVGIRNTERERFHIEFSFKAAGEGR